MDNKKNLYLLIAGVVAAVLVCIVLIGLVSGFWPWQIGTNGDQTGESTVATTDTTVSADPTEVTSGTETTVSSDPAETTDSTQPSGNSGNQGNSGSQGGQGNSGNGTTVDPQPTDPEETIPVLQPNEGEESEDSDIKIELLPDDTKPDSDTSVDSTEPTNFEIDFNDF